MTARGAGKPSRDSAITVVEPPSPRLQGESMVAEILLIGGTLLTAAGQVARIVKALR